MGMPIKKNNNFNVFLSAMIRLQQIMLRSAAFCFKLF